MRFPVFLASLMICAFPSLVAGQTTPSAALSGWQWPSTSPAAVGLDAEVLAALDADIGAGKFGNVDSMLIVRHGKLAYQSSYVHDYDRIYGAEAKEESVLNAHDPTGPYNYYSAWWHPYYRRGDLHTLQSVTKTVTSVVIGVAVTRGDFPDIDTPALQFFDTAKVANIDDRKRRMTVRQLLTMTAGLDWDETLPYTDPRNTAVQLEASDDWVQFAIDRPMMEEPGARFNYSSGVSALLAYIFRVATGQDIEEYAARHLFAPLHINDWYWKRSPTGLVDTEGGLYLRPGDLAKIWQMFLQNGSWQGKQIVSSAWVKDSVAVAVQVGDSGVQYGLQWWLRPYGAGGTKLAWAGSGFGGQIPVVVPEYDLVMVFTAWNIRSDRPALGWQEALDRVLAALQGEEP